VNHRRLKPLLVTVIAAVIAAAFTGIPFAQDTHYWTQQYGTQGELLLGTVVGSLIDLSSVYYNPGTLALQKNPSFILGAKAFEYQSVTFEDAEGTQSPLQAKSFGPAPTLFAGILPPKWMDGEIGYSVLTRNDFDFRLQAVTSGVVEPTPGDTIYEAGGEIYLDQEITGVWGGPTWSRAWGKMGVGVTGFIAYQSQRTRNQLVLQGLRFSPSDTTGASATVINTVDYWHVRAVFKFGVAWDYSPLTFGFAVTAPSIGLFGQGSGLADLFVNGIDLDDDGTLDSELIANSFKDEPSDYKSPASIAGGLGYRYKNTTFHFTAEYFGAVDKYDVLPKQVFKSSTTGNAYAQGTTLELNDVFNWGFGIEQHIRHWLKAYGSFIVDNSAYVEGTASNAAVSNWDLKHVMGGTAFSFLGNDITLGVGYTWGGEPVPKYQSVTTPDQTADVPALDIDAKLKYQRLKFILGFAFGSETTPSDS
jgi:hypothetical protein